MSSDLPLIDDLNRETPKVFIDTVNTLFETAPPLADRLLSARPFTSYQRLIDFAEEICMGNELSVDEKLEIINAHPRIGESKGNLSAMSLKEQGYSNKTSELSAEDKQINATLAKLNEEYEAKYGFKFVIFVAGRPRSQIIPIFRERLLANSKEKEMEVGIRDMMLIARDRLKKATESRL